jgi:uncharacterized membrane protein
VSSARIPPVQIPRTSLFILMAAMAWVFSGGAAAETDLILCNATPVPVSSVVAYQGNGEWRSRGWFTIYPGDCAVPDIETNNRYIYTHAVSGDVEWGGEHDFCVNPRDSFHYRKRDDCATTAGFREYDMGETVAYTITYECGDCDYIPTPQYYKNGLPLKVYGKWCGPGYPKGFDPGPPVDVIDTACFEHDQRYVDCARKPSPEDQLNCELIADSTLLSEFKSITSTGEHGLDPARLAYVGTMVRYLSYQAQVKYKAREARDVVEKGRDSINTIVVEMKRRARVTSSAVTLKLQQAWASVRRGPAEDNAILGREGWLRQRVGYPN